MTSGEKIALAAMKKEFLRLSKRAERVDAEYNEWLNIGTELISINDEFMKIVESKEIGAETIAALNALKKRSAKVERIRKKDFMKLSDKQITATMKRDELGQEIQRFGYGISHHN